MIEYAHTLLLSVAQVCEWVSVLFALSSAKDIYLYFLLPKHANNTYCTFRKRV